MPNQEILASGPRNRRQPGLRSKTPPARESITTGSRRQASRERYALSANAHMRKLRIGIIDIVSKGPTRALYARVLNASLASIMPQVMGVWCKEEGHEVTFVCYTGFEDLLTELDRKSTRLNSSHL